VFKLEIYLHVLYRAYMMDVLCFISVLSYAIALFVYFCNNLLDESLAVVNCFFTVCSVNRLFCQSQTT